MRCCICKKNVKLSRRETLEFRNLGFYTPSWWVKSGVVEEEDLERAGVNPHDCDSFLCFDCGNRISDHSDKYKDDGFSKTIHIIR